MPEARSEQYPNLYLPRIGVRFRAGKAEVSSEQAATLAAMGPRMGLKVLVEDAPLEKRTVAELKQYAADNGIDLGEAIKKPDILAAIESAEQS